MPNHPKTLRITLESPSNHLWITLADSPDNAATDPGSTAF